MQKKRILSGIQPTGEIHLGNYFGAIQNWVHLQEEYECVFSIVDYHAMTMPYQPVKLRENTWNLALDLVALGVNPDYLCLQSLAPEHTELAWILGCFCSYGELSRMTQFKDKSKQVEETDKDAFISAGLFTYPVLQAADILIYRADYVPVGEDQRQHLELTRNIAERFNGTVGKDYFVTPEILLTETPKIMSLADPTKKMSKSLGEKHYVGAFEKIESMQKKVRSAVTDTGGEATDEMSAGVRNLFTLLKASGKTESHHELFTQHQHGTLKYADLKQAVADGLAQMMAPFIERRAEIQADKKAMKERIKASSAAIRLRAQQTIKEVKELTGLANVRF